MWEQDNLTNVILHLLAVIRRDPDSVVAFLDLSLAYKLSGNLEDAAATLRFAIQLHPDVAPLYTRLSDVLCILKRYDQSIEYGLKRISMDSTDYEAHYIVGSAFFLTEHIDEALPFLVEAARIEPSSVGSRRMLGVTLCKKSRWMEAIPHLQFVVSRSPEDTLSSEWLDVANRLTQSGR
jgi:tetratricopeptide (TPR) repeat protein